MDHKLRVHLAFTPDDQAWLRRSSLPVPKFWEGHAAAPMVGDALRLGGRQFAVQARIWESDEAGPLLRLILGSGGAESDTSFGPL